MNRTERRQEWNTIWNLLLDTYGVNMSREQLEWDTKLLLWWHHDKPNGVRWQYGLSPGQPCRLAARKALELGLTPNYFGRLSPRAPALGLPVAEGASLRGPGPHVPLGRVPTIRGGESIPRLRVPEVASLRAPNPPPSNVPAPVPDLLGPVPPRRVGGTELLYLVSPNRRASLSPVSLPGSSNRRQSIPRVRVGRGPLRVRFEASRSPDALEPYPEPENPWVVQPVLRPGHVPDPNVVLSFSRGTIQLPDLGTPPRNRRARRPGALQSGAPLPRVPSPHGPVESILYGRLTQRTPSPPPPYPAVANHSGEENIRVPTPQVPVGQVPVRLSFSGQRASTPRAPNLPTPIPRGLNLRAPAPPILGQLFRQGSPPPAYSPGPLPPPYTLWEGRV